MLSIRVTTALFYSFMVTALVVLCGCAKPQSTVAEEPPPKQSEPQPEAAKPEQLPAQQNYHLPRPTLADARQVIERVYKDAVVVDTSRDENFFAGDFNGDLSEDIIIIVKPVEAKLGDINHELASWILEDPLSEALPSPRVLIQNAQRQPKRIQVEKGEALLAVIHGFGPDGWRNLEATQTYLLKNVAGSDIKPQHRDRLFRAIKGNALVIKATDVVEEVIGGEPGFIYYTGAKYAWQNKRSSKVNRGPLARSPH